MLRITKTESGMVRGIPCADTQITGFFGIPFAADTSGNNRFRVPQPAKSWNGIRDCIAYGPAPMQRKPGVGASVNSAEWHVDPEIPMSEDSLNLNIWTPAKTGDERLPVLIFLYGGAFLWGYTCQMELDGERLARRGIVVVTANYRMNMFGLLAHPELTAEAKARGEGYTNFGLYDQKAAIEWVYRNIASFGGDPESITLAGQSAGAASVAAQLASPLTKKGIIKRAILQSGGAVRNRKKITLEESEEIGKRFFEKIGIKTLAEARAISSSRLRDLVFEHLDEFPWSVSIDGTFLKEDPAESICEDRFEGKELMIGFTTNDLGGIRPGVSEMGKAVSEKGHDTYLYQFDGYMPGDDQGAFHSSELWFMFESLQKCWRPLDGRHYDLARIICNYWANFVKTGDPNGDDFDGPMPYWEKASAENDHGLLLNFETHMADICSTEKLDLNYKIDSSKT